MLLFFLLIVLGLILGWSDDGVGGRALLDRLLCGAFLLGV
jgi:hypothetical protein